jgi:hypothetical protein
MSRDFGSKVLRLATSFNFFVTNSGCTGRVAKSNRERLFVRQKSHQGDVSNGDNIIYTAARPDPGSPH